MYKDFFSANLDRAKIVAIDSIDKKHDKIFKNILSDVKEMQQFLKDFLEMEVNAENLEKYKNSFITSNFKNKESDIIYKQKDKQKDKQIYYLIEHQSSLDSNMPTRILNYCVELMREVQKDFKKQKNINPVIVPIVIYTGTKNWKIPINFSDTQKVEEKYKEYTINLKYKLIDINKYNKEELIKINTKLSSMLLIEKYQTSQEIRNILLKLNSINNNKDRKMWLLDVINYILADTLKEERQEIIKLILGGEDDMEEWLERVKRNDERIKRRIVRKALERTLIQYIRNMLNNKETDEKIMRYTNINQEELDRIKKKIEAQNRQPLKNKTKNLNNKTLQNI